MSFGNLSVAILKGNELNHFFEKLPVCRFMMMCRTHHSVSTNLRRGAKATFLSKVFIFSVGISIFEIYQSCGNQSQTKITEL